MRTDKVMYFLLGAIAVLLLMLVLQGQGILRTDEAVAAETQGLVGAMIVVPGTRDQTPLRSNYLWIIDARNGVMALYDYNESRRQLTLKAARNMRYDLRVDTEMNSRDGLNYEQMQEFVRSQ